MKLSGKDLPKTEACCTCRLPPHQVDFTFSTRHVCQRDNTCQNATPLNWDPDSVRPVVQPAPCCVASRGPGNCHQRAGMFSRTANPTLSDSYHRPRSPFSNSQLPFSCGLGHGQFMKMCVCVWTQPNRQGTVFTGECCEGIYELNQSQTRQLLRIVFNRDVMIVN